MKLRPCCKCGTDVIDLPHESADKLAVCTDCFRKMPSAALVEWSHRHDRAQHPDCNRRVSAWRSQVSR